MFQDHGIMSSQAMWKDKDWVPESIRAMPDKKLAMRRSEVGGTNGGPVGVAQVALTVWFF